MQFRWRRAHGDAFSRLIYGGEKTEDAGNRSKVTEEWLDGGKNVTCARWKWKWLAGFENCIPLRRHPTRILASLSRIRRNRSGTKKYRGHRRGIVAHVPTSCRLETSHAILRTSTTWDKTAGIVAEHTSRTNRDLDSPSEIALRYCRSRLVTR